MLLNDVFDEMIPPSPLPDEYPVDERKCRLLGPTALVVQTLMGVFVILSLIYKRQREKTKRPWKIWMFDVSKQIVGQMFVHGINLLISDVGAHHSSGNPCAVYFLNILIDTTLGVGIIYFIYHSLTYTLSNVIHLKGFKSGQYGSPPSAIFWFKQAVVYVTALTTMKLLVVGLFALWPGIFKLGDWLLSWTGGVDAVQVIFVMGLFPIVMNVLQFWLIDSIVKATSQDDGMESRHSPRQSEDREPLVNGERHDDDDDDNRTTFDIESQHGLIPKSQSFDDNETMAEEDQIKAPLSRVSTISLEDDHAYPPLSSSQGSHSSFDSNRSREGRSPQHISTPSPSDLGQRAVCTPLDSATVDR